MDDVVTSIMHRMSTEAQYSTDATIRDFQDASSLITDYQNKRMWEVRIHTDPCESLPSDFYYSYDNWTYQDAIGEAQRVLEKDLCALIDNGCDPFKATEILEGRYEVRLAPRYREVMDAIRSSMI